MGPELDSVYFCTEKTPEISGGARGRASGADTWRGGRVRSGMNNGSYGVMIRLYGSWYVSRHVWHVFGNGSGRTSRALLAGRRPSVAQTRNRSSSDRINTIAATVSADKMAATTTRFTPGGGRTTSPQAHHGPPPTRRHTSYLTREQY